MKQTPDQAAINALAQEVRSKRDPKIAQVNGKPEAIGVEGTAGTSTLEDNALLDILFGEQKEGEKWREVYSGNWEPHYDTQSQADAAILWKLAFYSHKDPLQMERLIRESGLAREKWNERRGGSTWLAGEIARAIESTTEGYEPRNPKPGYEVHSRSHSLGNTGMRNDGNDDLKHSIQALSFSGRDKPAPREWILDNSIWTGHATSWFGEGGVAKSLLALHLGITVAAPSRSYWMAFAVKTAPVLYLDFELDADEQHRRALDLAAGMRLRDIPADFYYLTAAMLPPRKAFERAAEECRRLGIKLVIVDSVGFALDGDSENARDVLGFYRACIQPLKDAGASPLLIDHQAKIIKGEKYSDKQAFGSVYKTNAVRSSFQIRGSHEQGDITATFTHKKNNFGWKERDFSLKVVFEEGCTTVERLEKPVPNPDREPSKKELVFAAVEKLGRASADTVSTETGIDLKTVQNAFTDLVREGALKDTGDKQNRSRILIPHSRTTRGTGTGMTENEEVLTLEACVHGQEGGCVECRRNKFSPFNEGEEA